MKKPILRTMLVAVFAIAATAAVATAAPLVFATVTPFKSYTTIVDDPPGIRTIIKQLSEASVRREDGALQVVDVTLTSAQVLALNATPVQVIAAPATGRVRVFEGAYLYKPDTDVDGSAALAYAAIATTEDFLFRYTNGSGAVVGSNGEATGFLDTVNSRRTWIPPKVWGNGISGDATGTALATTDAKIVIQMSTGEVTTGTAQVKVRAFFRDFPGTF